jgi:hypothetical protein
MKDGILTLTDAIQLVGERLYPVKWNSDDLRFFTDFISENRNHFHGDRYCWNDDDAYLDRKYKIYTEVLNSIINWVRGGALPLFTHEKDRPLEFHARISQGYGANKFHELLAHGKITDDFFEDIGIYEGEIIFVWKRDLNKCFGVVEVENKTLGGRKPKYPWHEILIMLLERSTEEDLFYFAEDGKVKVNEAVPYIQDLCRAAFPNQDVPSDTAIKDNITTRLNHWRTIRHNISKD